MGWIQDHRRQTSQNSDHQPDPESQFAAAARARWLELGDELRADVAEFNNKARTPTCEWTAKINIASETQVQDWNWCLRLISIITP